MKNTKFEATLKILILIVITVLITTFVLLPNEIIYKKASVINDEEEIRNDDVAGEDEIKESVTDENTEDEETEFEEEAKEDKTFKNVLSYQNINLGLDFAGGINIVYETASDVTESEMKLALELIANRLKLMGYMEAEVTRQDLNKIRVELPRVSDPQITAKEIGRTMDLKIYGFLKGDFQIFPIEEEGAISQYAILEPSDTAEQGYEIYTGANIDEIAELVVPTKDVAVISKQYAASQTASRRPYIKVELSSEGKKLFAEATKKYRNNFIVVVLDDEIRSIQEVSYDIIDGIINIAEISNDKEIDEFVKLINLGRLPFKLEPVEINAINARLGQDALVRMLLAGIITIILIFIYMLIAFRLSGLIAGLSLITYLSLIMAALSIFNITLTLLGVAGIILSIIVAMDANIIIFTRIKKEVGIGKAMAASIETGFKKSLSAIIDGNIAILIIAGILYLQGIGPMKGFAQTLIIGIIISMFISIIITRIYIMSLISFKIKSQLLCGVISTSQYNISQNELNKKAQKNKKRG